MLHEIGDATGVAVRHGANAAIDDLAGVVTGGTHSHALVGKGQCQSAIKEGHFLEAACQDVEVINGGVKDFAVRPKRDSRSRLRSLATLLEGSSWNTVLVVLSPHESVAGYFNRNLGRQGVHNRNANAMQTTRCLI